ncbi:protein TIFY 6B isoform X2 [Diospyros lotus]|uniref:protein TIFY 6B isoform X2 n=1 Tax=Diospyros lotus TaxID=55363 RepID=UPI002253C8B3|nr:protein TIFY 6B isoform X2 [Diospyros lotus]
MERDFLGLASRRVSVPVRGEIPVACKDSAPTRTPTMQRSYPQFLSFSSTQDDGTRKTGFDSLSTGFMTISTTEPFNCNQKPHPSNIQKNLTSDKQVGTHYTVTTYHPAHQFDAHSILRPHEVRMATANQTSQKISVTMRSPAHQSFLASAGQNVIGSTINTRSLGGLPVISPVSMVPTSTSVVGTTDLRNASKPSGGSAQLTIFYAGSVCVYDDVSPEKAQAIMLLAGNGHPATPNKTIPITQVEAPVPRSSGIDGFAGNQSHNPSSCPALPSPISVTSHVATQSVGGSNNTTDATAVRSVGALTSPSTKAESSKIISLTAPVSCTLIPSAAPQARKASLARFLEKRKERAMNASPYASKQTPDCSPSGSQTQSLSVNAAGSCPLPARH